MHRYLLAPLAVVAALTGCGDRADDDNGSASPPAAQTTTQAEEPDSEQPSSTAAADERRLRRYLKENFGGAFGPESKTSWYDDIKRVRIGGLAGETVFVETDYFNDADVTESANGICRAVLLGLGDLKTPIATVEVLDKSDDTITDCSFGG